MVGKPEQTYHFLDTDNTTSENECDTIICFNLLKHSLNIFRGNLIYLVV